MKDFKIDVKRFCLEVISAGSAKADAPEKITNGRGRKSPNDVKVAQRSAGSSSTDESVEPTESRTDQSKTGIPQHTENKQIEVSGSTVGAPSKAPKSVNPAAQLKAPRLARPGSKAVEQTKSMPAEQSKLVPVEEQESQPLQSGSKAPNHSINPHNLVLGSFSNIPEATLTNGYQKSVKSTESSLAKISTPGASEGAYYSDWSSDCSICN